MNNHIALSICNNVRMGVEGISRPDLPLDVFPQKVRKIIIDLSTYENFNTEYTMAALLSAAATAIGNTHQIRAKGYWNCSPTLYLILVGRAGAGKTPPMEFAYSPIRKRDAESFRKFRNEMEEFETLNQKRVKGKEDSVTRRRPVLVKTIVSDFTTEALFNVHKNNPRGVAVLVDEVMALFKSINRYTNGNPLVEHLLTSYSGQALDSVRKSESTPVQILRPCINLIGSIQTPLLKSVFTREYTVNGLPDRILFVFPKDNYLSPWKKTPEGAPVRNMDSCWREIVEKLLSLPLDVVEDTVNPKVLDFSVDAYDRYFDWNNAVIEEANSIGEDSPVGSRKIKMNGNLARLALILQMLRWASGESHKEYVDLVSVNGAIRLIDYFEDSYARMNDAITMDEIGEVMDTWLSLLPDEFTTADAVTAAVKLGMSRRTVFNKLVRLAAVNNSPIRKEGHGRYSKVQASTCDALCTSALSNRENGKEPASEQATPGERADETTQSAIVQGANDISLIKEEGDA